MAGFIGSKISKEIQEELKRRELISSRAVKTLPIPGSGKDVEFADYASKSHYAIMATMNVDEKTNKAIAAGEVIAKNNNVSNMTWGFKSDGSGAYRNTEAGSGAGIRPVAGLKSITSEFRGQNLYSRNTVINWTAPSLESLQEFSAFVTIGQAIAVQWGFVGAKTTLDGNENFIEIFDDRISVKRDILRNPRDRIKRANGNMDGVAGKIKDFQMRLRDDGSFDCTTEIISIGSSIFSRDSRIDDIEGFSAVLPTDVENKLEQIANGLLPDSVVGVLDEATNAVQSVLSFLDPTSTAAAEEVARTEDHMLNAILNLDNIVDAHMATNGFYEVKAVIPTPVNEANPPETKVKEPVGPKLITLDETIKDPTIQYFETISIESLQHSGNDYAMQNALKEKGFYIDPNQLDEESD